MKPFRLLTALILLLSPALTAAQPDPAAMISRRALDRFSHILLLDKDQTDLANALYDGYTTAYRAAVRASATEVRRIRETDGPKAPQLAEHTAAALKAKTDRQAALEQSFFSDIHALLTEHQAKSWPAVERARRRDRLLPGVVSGENVDLIEILDSLHFPPNVASLLAPTIAAYELDLDRALLDKQRVLKEERPFDALHEFNANSLIRRASQTRDSGLTIRDINGRFAHQLESALSERYLAAFRTAVHAAGFPSVYATTRGSRLLSAAFQLADLDATQRDTLASIRKAYESDLAAANIKHEDAIRDAESAKQSIIMPMESGGTYQVMMGKMEDNAVMKARKSKQDLDTQLRDRLEKLLNLVQLDALPDTKEGASDEQIFMDDTAVMIRRGG